MQTRTKEESQKISLWNAIEFDKQTQVLQTALAKRGLVDIVLKDTWKLNENRDVVKVKRKQDRYVDFAGSICAIYANQVWINDPLRIEKGEKHIIKVPYDAVERFSALGPYQ